MGRKSCTLSSVVLRRWLQCEQGVAGDELGAKSCVVSLATSLSPTPRLRSSITAGEDSKGHLTARRTTPVPASVRSAPFQHPQPVPPAMDLVSTAGATTAAGLQAWASMLAARSSNGVAREERAGGGTSVSLTVAEVDGLRHALLEASETLLDAPISRRDFAALLGTVLAPQPALGLALRLDAPAPAPALPAEIISIIVKQVRALYEAEKDDLRSMSSEHRGWKGLRRLERVSKRWRLYVPPLACYPRMMLTGRCCGLSVVNRMYLEELHLSDPAMFSFIAKLLTGTRAELLSKLYISLS